MQELLSGEGTPTLCEVLPQYENVLVMLQDLRSIKLAEKKPRLARAINVTMKKIEEYILKSRKSRVYALAMSKPIIFSQSVLVLIQSCTVINPTMKTSWIEEHWTWDEASDAKDWLKASVSIIYFGT